MLLRKNYRPESKIEVTVAKKNYRDLCKKGLLILSKPLKESEFYWAAPGNVLEINYNSQKIRISGNSNSFPKTEEVAERLLETKLFWFSQEG